MDEAHAYSSEVAAEVQRIEEDRQPFVSLLYIKCSFVIWHVVNGTFISVALMC